MKLSDTGDMPKRREFACPRLYFSFEVHLNREVSLTWSVTLRAFEDRALRNILGPKRWGNNRRMKTAWRGASQFVFCAKCHWSGQNRDGGGWRV